MSNPASHACIMLMWYGRLMSVAYVSSVFFFLQPCAATDLLAEKLDTSPFEGNGQQKALYISYIYGNIMYASEKGFPWDHVCCVTEFAEQYLKKIIGANTFLLIFF